MLRSVKDKRGKEAIEIHKHPNNFNRKEEGLKLNNCWHPVLKRTKPVHSDGTTDENRNPASAARHDIGTQQPAQGHRILASADRRNNCAPRPAQGHRDRAGASRRDQSTPRPVQGHDLTGADRRDNGTPSLAAINKDEQPVRSSVATVVMDVIKIESEIDPLALERSNNTDVVEQNSLSQEGNSLDLHMTKIKTECMDHSYDLKSEVTFEETSVPFDFAIVKSEIKVSRGYDCCYHAVYSNNLYSFVNFLRQIFLVEAVMLNH
ncbi:hypothetical protein ANN_27545 [Periplaneta americana]|uniref:Uncharacterized protein n=1 Tax=Periplaneta americana TaxID=6978 RepID=A0ABQ8RW30_PERAM|nr:hypothetical protein ANN_27545 [Periplaneta americana]